MLGRVVRRGMGACPLILLYLLLRGRLCGIVWVRPFHLMGVTRFGYYVHFTTLRTRERFAPWWYEGVVEVRRVTPWRRKVLRTWRWGRGKHLAKHRLPRADG